MKRKLRDDAGGNCNFLIVQDRDQKHMSFTDNFLQFPFELLRPFFQVEIDIISIICLFTLGSSQLKSEHRNYL